jgi:transcriptional regulator with XRE-family HTH domain
MGVIAAMIEERMDQLDERVTWSELAKKLGVNPGTISHFRNDGNELNFKSLLNLSKFLYKNNYIDVMSEWCLNLKLPKNLKCALEFLSSHRRLDELELLIQTINNEYDSKELRNWTDLYKILIKHQRNPNDTDYIYELREYFPKSVETKILSSIVEIYYFHRKNEYKNIFEKSVNLPHCFEMIKDEFIRDSFEFRLCEILGYISLYWLADSKKAREYASKIIFKDNCAVFAVSSYYIMGMSLIFEDYDKCLYYLNKYDELLRKYDWKSYIEDLHNSTIPFINNLWGKTNSSDEISDISEKAHYEAKYGNKETAIELLDNLVENESALALYYRGIAENDSTILLQSLVKFMKSGNKFFAKLPYELLKSDTKLFKVAELIFNE